VHPNPNQERCLFSPLHAPELVLVEQHPYGTE
jgi:hypothetical protein